MAKKPTRAQIAKMTPEQKREYQKAQRRERYAAHKAEELGKQAEELEQARASEESEGKTDLTAIAPTQRQRAAIQGGSRSPTQIAKARDNLAEAFEMMGGVPGLVRWGRKNPTEFYRIWARLIPKEAVEATTSQPLEQLLAQLATKSEKSVAEAAYEIGEETLAAAATQVSLEDARAAFIRNEEDTLQ